MDPKALKIASTLPWRMALQLQSRDRLDKMIRRVRNSLACQALLAFSVSSSFRPPPHSEGILIRSFTLSGSELFSLLLENSEIRFGLLFTVPNTSINCQYFFSEMVVKSSILNKFGAFAQRQGLVHTLLIRIFWQPDPNLKHEEWASLAPRVPLFDLLIWCWSFRRCAGELARQ